MNKRILLGIDTNISPSAQLALQAVIAFMEQAAPQLHVVLLSVIPVPYMTSPSLGMYVGHLIPMSITPEQRSQAEADLRHARTELQKGGVAPEQIEVLMRVGIPAEEIVRAAKELQVSFIVVGSRGNSRRQSIRRFLAGSTSRRVLQLAHCPVMIVSAPRVQHPTNLVTWYSEEITQYLQQHPDSLSVFTPREVAQMFVPPNKKKPGRKEIAAATLALEELTGSGVLCR
ncbi:MAG TPA: universal stress protein, partial [Ktedonobacteraceae bacterium]